MKSFFRGSKSSLPDRLNLGLLVWFILAIFFVFGGMEKWWTDSEMWSAVATGALFDAKPEYFFGIKPLFHLITWFNVQVASAFGVHPMVTGRMAWAVIALLIMVLCDRLLQKRNVSESGRLLFQLLLFGTSTWTFRSSEIRSDLLASFIVFLLLVGLDRKARKYRYVLMGSALAAAVLVTAKGGLLFVALFPFLLSGSKRLRPSKRFIALGLIGLLLMGALFFRTFSESFQFLMNQFKDNSGVHYFSLIRFEHVFRMHVENPQILIVLFSAFLISFKRGIRDHVNRPLFISLILFYAIIWLYPDPLPFFLAAYLPFIYLFSFLIIFSEPRAASFLNRRGVVLSLSVLLVGNFSVSIYRIFNHSNHTQKSIAEWAVSELGDRDALIYDPTGILPAKNSEHWFLGPAMGADSYKGIFNTILSKEPDVIFYTEKLNYLAPGIFQVLQKKYFRWAPSVFIRLISLEPYSELGCDEIEAVSLKEHPGSKSKEGLVSVMRVLKDKQILVELDQNLEAVCRHSRTQKDEGMFIFATQPPRSPVENFTYYFRYDFFF